MLCKNCKSEIDADAKFCTHCGAKVLYDKEEDMQIEDIPLYKDIKKVLWIFIGITFVIALYLLNLEKFHSHPNNTLTIEQIKPKAENAANNTSNETNCAYRIFNKFILPQEKNFYANINRYGNNDISFDKLKREYLNAIEVLNDEFYNDIDPNDKYYKDNWVQLLSSEGSYYYAINYKYLSNKYGCFLSIGYKEWLEHLSETQQLVDDAYLTVEPDKIREYIIYLENIVSQNPNLISNEDIKNKIKTYLRIYLIGLDNSPIFDRWSTKRINPEFKLSYEKFLLENKNSNYYQMVEEFYNRIKKQDFIWSEDLENWQLNTFYNKYW